MADIPVVFRSYAKEAEVNPENILKKLDEMIIGANRSIHSATMNGSSNETAEGYRKAAKYLKEWMFGEVYNT